MSDKKGSATKKAGAAAAAKKTNAPAPAAPAKAPAPPKAEVKRLKQSIEREKNRTITVRLKPF